MLESHSKFDYEPPVILKYVSKRPDSKLLKLVFNSGGQSVDFHYLECLVSCPEL